MSWLEVQNITVSSKSKTHSISNSLHTQERPHSYKNECLGSDLAQARVDSRHQLGAIATGSEPVQHGFCVV